jgi:uncharacterized protein (DUF488 family)
MAAGTRQGEGPTVTEQRPTIFTLGHSTHDWETFLALLKRHGITAVADVRSQPYGRLEHFRRQPLESALRVAGIDYVFLGRELGARRDEPECYVNGEALYDRVAQLPAFREGLDRLERGAAAHTIALVCAEREPLDCHRTVLVARHLAARGWRVRHILADGQIEEHADTERRLVREMGIDPLFDRALTESQLVQRAYDERGREIAYRDEKENSG